MIYEVGRVCMKIAGRDANQYCVIIKKIDSNTVEIDGQTRRRKCSVNHIEPISKVLELKAGASHEEVVKAMKHAGYEMKEKAAKKEKSKSVKPKKTRTPSKKK